MERAPGEHQEAFETLKTLQSYLDQGYLLHGSKMRIDILKPRTARDDSDGRTIGKMTGVYADDDLRAPILMALFDRKDPNISDWRSSYQGNDENTFVSGENMTFTPGFVHVLPKDTFTYHEEGDDGEFVSNQPVTPVEIVPVTPDILRILEGVTIPEEFFSS
jgi:hypothetical protein